MNKIYKVIWNALLGIWVVASELAKGKGKVKTTRANKSSHSPEKKKVPSISFFRKNLLTLCFMATGLLGSPWVFGATLTAGTQSELISAINSAVSGDTISLTNNIMLNSTSISFNMNNRDITIDGGGVYSIINKNGLSGGFTISGGTGSLTFQNIDQLITSNYYSMVRVESAANVQLTFNDINTLGNTQAIWMGAYGSSNSTMNFGNIKNDVIVEGGSANQEIGEVSHVTFSGRFHVNHTNNYTSFDDSSGTQNTGTMIFYNGADVLIDRTGSGAKLTPTGTSAFQYTLDDGSKFELIASQDVFSGASNNRGFQIGSYDSSTGEFGSGGNLILEKDNKGATISGNAIDNLTTNTSGYDIGASGAGDVIFNLGDESKLASTGNGILATKASSSAAGIYIRNAGSIQSPVGINATQNGSGKLIVNNAGTITATTSGIQVSSTATSKAATIDNTDGTITVSGGNGVDAQGNTILSLTGGTINANGSSNSVNAVNIANTAAATHTLTDLIINLVGSALAINKTDNASVLLKNVTVNVNDGTGFNDISNLNFASSTTGTNTINVGGAGKGISTTNTELTGLNNDSMALLINVLESGIGVQTTGGGVDLTTHGLNIDVQNASGTGLVVADGVADDTTTNTTTIGSKVTLDGVAGSTAIRFDGTQAKTLNNAGNINGNVVFNNDANNIINNTSTLNGTLTTGSGNDTLTLASGSNSLGEIDLGDGNNIVNIDGAASVNSIITGSGDDVFNISNLTSSSSLLADLNAGAGTNTLNVSNTINTLTDTTKLTGFNEVNLSDNTKLTLDNVNNIGLQSDGSLGTYDIDHTSQLNFGSGFSGTVNSIIGKSSDTDGDGSVNVNNGANVTLANDNAFSGDWLINGVLNASGNGQLADSQAMEVDGTLNLNGLSELNSILTGTGVLNINDASDFTFGSNTGDGFTGSVNLAKSSYTLSADNATAVANATLVNQSGSTLDVTGSATAVKNLTLDGGKTQFTNTSTITTGELKVNSPSEISVDYAEGVEGNLLDQNAGISRQLIAADNSLQQADLDNLTVFDQNDEALGDNTLLDIEQNGSKVAEGTYDFGIDGTKGLLITSKLIKLALESDATVNLDTLNADNQIFTALITGQGNLSLNANSDTLVLNNSANDYQGKTLINSGTVQSGSNSALGSTSDLTVAQGATFDLNSKQQNIDGAVNNSGSLLLNGGTFTADNLLTNSGSLSVGSGTLTTDGITNSGGNITFSAQGTLTNSSDLDNTGVISLAEESTLTNSGELNNQGTISLNGGTLTTSDALTNNGSDAVIDITDGNLNLGNGGTSSVEGGLTGDGTLNVTGGTLSVSAANTALSGLATISDNSAISLTGLGTLGSSNIDIATGGTLNLAPTGNVTVSNKLSGSGVINTQGAVTLSNSNTFTGQQQILKGGTLSISDASNLGADSAQVNLVDSTSKLVLNGVSSAVTQALSGIAGSTISLVNGSNVSLGTSNSNFLGTYSVNDSSTLNISSTSQPGTSASYALNSDAGTTSLNFIDYNGVFANSVTGSGLIALTNSTSDSQTALTLNSTNAIADGVGFLVNQNNRLNLDGLATFNHALTGDGTLNINGESNEFNFGSNAATGFSGSVNLENLSLALSGDNSAALTDAQVTNGSNAQINVGSGDQDINELVLNGGTTQFTDSTSEITADNLDVTSQSAVKIGASDSLAANLIDQTTQQSRKLIDSKNTLSDEALALLTLQNAEGESLGSNSALDIVQAGKTVAKGLYNYQLSNAGTGLSTLYQLVSVAIGAENTLSLDTTGSTSLYKIFTAKISDDTLPEGTTAGNLLLNANDSTLILNNAENDYTGATSVASGTVRAGSNNAFGQTSGLTLASGSTVDLNGKTQTLGSLTNAGTLNLNGGSLTLTQGGTSTSTGGLTGSGNLILNGGELNISSANSGLTSTTQATVDEDGTLTLAKADALGQATINNAGRLNLYAQQTFANTLQGNGSVYTDNSVTLQGDNQNFTGQYHVITQDDNTGNLILSQASSLGGTGTTVSLDSASSALTLDKFGGNFTYTLNGVGGSTLALTNNADVNLGSNISGFSGNYSINGDSVLTMTQINGQSKVTLGGAGNTLALSGLSGVFTNSVSGTGDLLLTNSSALSLNGDNSLADDVGVTINSGSSLTLDDLNIFNHALSGSGTIAVSSSDKDQSFSFGSGVGSAFTGMLDLSQVQYNLSADNTTALSQADLNVGSDATLVVGTGTQAIGGLNLNGGKTVFASGSEIGTGTLRVTGTNTIQVAPSETQTANLLDQDDGVTQRLINTSTQLTTDDLSKLTLEDADGQQVDKDYQQAIVQNNAQVAQGFYNYGLTGLGGGLSVIAQLVKLALTQGQSVALNTDGATSTNFLAQITGAGGLTLQSGTDNALTLSNANNDYTGATQILAGTVQAGSDSALGNTSALTLGSDTAFNLGTYTQTIGSLANGGTLNLGSGILNISGGGTSSGTLSGSGNLNVTGGVLAVTSANSALTAATAISQGAGITLSNAGTLGSGAITVDGSLNLNNSQTLANVLTGDGTITTGSNVTLTGTNTFAGHQVINTGATLNVATAANLGSNAATVTVNNGGTLALNGMSGSNGEAVTLANALSGSGGTVSLNTLGTGESRQVSNVQLTGDNSAFDGSYAVSGGSTLTAGSQQALGGSNATVALNSSDSTLNLSDFSGILDNSITGSGLLTLTSDSDLTLSNNGVVASTVGVNLDGSSSLTLSGLDSFNHVLTGSGDLNINGTGSTATAFSFLSQTGSAFSGDVTLNNVSYDLTGNNASALSGATLITGDKSQVTVNDSESLGNLTLNGGTLTFNQGTVSTNKLALGSQTVVQVAPDLTLGSNLIDQSLGATRTLVSAQTGPTQAAINTNLSLEDTSGHALSSSGTEVNITQGGTALLGVGTYTYGLNNLSGLSVIAQLVKLALAQGQSVALNTDGATSTNFLAQITGAGGLTLQSGTDNALTLSNANNDYTGATQILAGTVQAGSDSALGNTSALTLGSGTAFNLGTYTQTIGSLANGGTLNLGSGILNISGGGTSSGTLSGSGNLNVTGGVLAVTSANSALTAATAISQGAGVTLSNAGTLGSGAITVDGSLNLNNSQTLANVLTGDGTITTGSNVTLTGTNTFAGHQVINTGATLNVATAANLGSNAATVTVNNGGTLALNGMSGSNGEAVTLANALSGSGGTVSLNTLGTGESRQVSNVQLTGDNSAFDGSYAVSGGSTLTAGSQQALGGSDATVALNSSDSTLNLSDFSGSLDNRITGSGLLTLTSDSDLTLSDNGIVASTVGVNLDGSSSLTLSGLDSFNHTLTGSGDLNINGTSSTPTAFSFLSQTGSAFSGDVTLNNVSYDLTGNNASALSGATLITGDKSQVTVNDSESLGNLTLDGGTLTFNQGTVSTNKLALGSQTVVQVAPDLTLGSNLIDQSLGATRTLVSAQTGPTQAAINTNLSLEDTSGHALSSSGTEVNITQGGTALLGVGTYTYGLSNLSGLSVIAQLVKLALTQGQSVALNTDGATSTNFLAQITGAGGLTLQSGTDNALTLSNANNDYTGATQILAGTVQAGSDSALGNTSALTLGSGTAFNLGAYTQTVGALTNKGSISLTSGKLSMDGGDFSNQGSITLTSGSLNTGSGLFTNQGDLNLGSGTLNISGGGTSSGTLSGSGKLNITAGSLAVTSANSGLTGSTDINQGASLTLSDKGTLGTSAINIGGDLNLNASQTLANVLSGNGIVTTDSAITLTGANSFTGSHVIDDGASLTVSSAKNLGVNQASTASVEIAKNGNLILNDLRGALANILSGEGNVLLQNGSQTVLSGSNNAFSGSYALNNASTLTVSKLAQLGNTDTTVSLADADSQLNLVNYNSQGTFTNNVTGNGQLVLSGTSDLQLASKNIADTVGINLGQQSQLSLTGLTALLDTSGSFNHALSGDGSLSVNGDSTGNQTFAFGSNTGSAFGGVVSLNNTMFDLADSNNTTALASGTLNASTGSQVKVGSEDRTLNNLTLSGGALDFSMTSPQQKADGIINTGGTLQLDKGTVNIASSSSWENVDPAVSPALSLLEQDKGQILMTLINASQVSGNTDNLALTINGQSISQADSTLTSNILQNGQVAATSTYSYGLTDTKSATESGLYLKYSLNGLNLIADGDNALLLKTVVGENQTLHTLLSGSGGLVIDGSAGSLTLANENNSYSGTTTVTDGGLTLGANNSLGQTSALTVKESANVDIGDYIQHVGALINQGLVKLGNGALDIINSFDNSGVVNVGTGTGTLALSQGGTSSSTGGISGQGTLDVQGGSLNLNAANSQFTGNINIGSQAGVVLNSANALGTASVDLADSSSTLSLNAEDTLANTLSGSGTLNTQSDVTLTGNNQSFTGQYNIEANGALTVNSGDVLGGSSSVLLSAADTSLNLDGFTATLSNVMSGVANSAVDLVNGAAINLTGNNSAFKGEFNLTDRSQLTVSDSTQLGSASAINLQDDSSTLALSGYKTSSNNTFDYQVTGVGTLRLDNGSNITLDGTRQNIDAGVGFDLDSTNDSLTLSGLSSFNHQLSGQGILNVTQTKEGFTFGSEAQDSGFTGTVNMGTNSSLTLGGTNQKALNNAEVMLSSGSTTTVADGTQNIGSLVMNGGALVYDNITDNGGQLVSSGVINADSINTTAGGTINVNLPTTITPDINGVPLLDMDEGNMIITLAKGTATGSGANLTLLDTNNTPLANNVTTQLSNAGQSVVSAIGHFNFGISTGEKSDGLYVNYGLKSIDLLGNDSDALIIAAQSANNGTNANDLSSTLSGSGDIAFSATDSGAIASLSNNANNYTGKTLVRSGGLRLDSDNALGQTSALEQSAGTTVDLNKTTQTVGQLNSDKGSLFDLNGGSLTLTGGGQVEGLLSGDGHLNLTGGSLTLSQANTDYTGQTTIASGATGVISNAAGLGSGKIVDQGQLTLEGVTGTVANAISDNGDLSLLDSSSVIFSGDNSNFSGSIDTDATSQLQVSSGSQLGSANVVNSGQLVLASSDKWSLTNSISGSGTLVKKGQGTVQLLNSTVSAANTVIENGILQLGADTPTVNYLLRSARTSEGLALDASNNSTTLVSNVSIEQNGTLGGFGRVTGNVDNAGRLVMPHALTGNSFANFIVNGNYTGQTGSQLVFDTVLAGDNSETDRLYITGNANGESSVVVNNMGGSGATTTTGIKLIDIAGKSDANFTLANRVVAGAYEYQLVKGSSATGDGNWYLKTPDAELPTRPEAGSYISNLAAANTLFNANMANRAGETWYTDVLTGKREQTSMWIRSVGGRTSSKDTDGTFTTHENHFVTQIGGDIYRAHTQQDNLMRIGLMGGYGRSSSSTTSITGTHSKGDLNGYSIGTYGSWFEDPSALTGGYADSWLQYSWFKNHVNGEGLSTESYNSQGFTASIEGGYIFNAGQSASYNYYLQPKVQGIWMGVKANGHTEASNTYVSGTGNGNLQTRVGLKAFFTERNPNDAILHGSRFKPYAEATWIHNTKDFGVDMTHPATGSYTVKQGGAANVAEVKVGLEGNINPRLNAWGNVTQQVGSQSYRDTSVTLGIKYNF